MNWRERLFGRRVWKVTRQTLIDPTNNSPTDLANVSALAGGEARVQYCQHKAATAPDWLAERGYHLTCFSDRASAELFVNTNPRYVVWEALAWGRIKNLPNMYDAHALQWRGELDFVDPGGWPPGTLMAKRIMLIKRVA